MNYDVSRIYNLLFNKKYNKIDKHRRMDLAKIYLNFLTQFSGIVNL